MSPSPLLVVQGKGEVNCQKKGSRVCKFNHILYLASMLLFIFIVQYKLTCRFLGRLRKKKKRKQLNPWQNQMIEQNLVIVTGSAARKADVIPHLKALLTSFLLHVLVMTTTNLEKQLQPWCLSVPANKMTRRRRLKAKGWF